MSGKDTVIVGDRKTHKITCTAFVFLAALMILSIGFLILTFVRSNDYVVLRRYCIKGSSDLVFPGPSPVTGDATAYLIGPVAFHRTEPYVEWDLYHSASVPVGALQIIGPVTVSNPYDGPVYLTLCQTGTTVPCLFTANRLNQRITSLPTGQPLDDFVDRIVDYPHRYKFVFSTITLNDTLVPVYAADLDRLC